MQERLADLGCQMVLEPIPDYPDPLPFEEYRSNDPYPRVGQQMTSTSHTVDRSVHNKGYADGADESSSPQTSRPHKRARIDTSPRSRNIHAAPSSRDLMPPPPKTMSRMASVRNLIPKPVRQRFSSKGKGKATKPSTPVQIPGSDVQMSEGGYDEPVEPLAPSSSARDTRHGTQQGPYMSGALPVGYTQPATSIDTAQLATSVGHHRSGTEFTFRSASPIKLDTNRPDKLPTQPSYIRLMDGLSSDTGLNLGLQDPRIHTSDQIHHESQIAASSEHDGGEGPSRQHRGSQRNDRSSLRFRLSNAFIGNTRDRGAVDPVTPVPSRSRSTQEVENVVSPFFGNRDRNSLLYPRVPNAERHDSMIRSNGYPLHRQRKLDLEPPPPTSWREGRSLNGLSFFDSPLNKWNETIEWRHARKPSEKPLQSQRYHSRNLNSRGFIKRPDDGLPFENDRHSSTLERPFSQQHPVQFHSTNPSQFSSHASHSRAAPPKSATHSNIHHRIQSPVHANTHLVDLERAGVRSSRASHILHSGRTSSTPVTNLFTGSGRRTIRR